MVHGDRFILCSDGLVDEVHDDDIAAIAVAATEPQACAEQLIAKANANGGRDNVTVVVVDVLQGVEPTAADAEMESEPGWPGSETTGTMIDADANSVLSNPAVIAVPGAPLAPPIMHAAGPDEPVAPGHWGTRRLLKLIGAAAVLTVVITLIAVLLYNRGDEDAAPPVTTTAVTEPDETQPASSTTSSSTSSTSTTSTPLPTTTNVGTSTSGP